MRGGTLVLALLLAGCVEGEPKFFPDESAKVRSIHVNAYAEEVRGGGAPEGKVEISGTGPDGAEKAFQGTVRIQLEVRDASQAEHTYSRVKEWTVEVAPEDFASPTVPFFVFVIDSSEFPRHESYRVSASATIGGRAVPSDGKLVPFEWSGAPTS